MYKIYQSTIYNTRLVGEFRTLEEAKKVAKIKKKEGVGIIRIKKYGFSKKN
jgi:hypothetical protein